MTVGVDAFADFVKTRPMGERGRGSRSVIDEAPSDNAEMAAYFLSLQDDRLASCWVACVVDGAISGWEPGPLARALVVVAERLHGVKFDEQPIGEPVMTQMRAAKPPIPAATTAPEPRPTAAKMVGDIEIHTGPPPAAKPKRMRGSMSQVIAAASVLPPGGWFIWKDAPKTLQCIPRAKKLSAAVGFEVIVYRTVPGTVVVQRPAPGGA